MSISIPFKQRLVLCILCISLLFFQSAFATGNKTNDSFAKAKKDLLTKVYFDHHTTIYCGASFDSQKHVKPLSGFRSPKFEKRAQKIEWEHVVPAENFGRTFVEWRSGDPLCVDKKGKKFKGRKCARTANEEFRRMEADMHNLFPAIGAVNAARSNFNFVMLPGSVSSFGSCDMHIENRKVQPSEFSRGPIARAYLYMDKSYSRFTLSSQQRKLMTAWNKAYPVSEWECTRDQRITKIQGNSNTFVSDQCR